RKFPWLDYLLQEATCSVERRISLFWIVRGRTRMSTSLQSLHGVVSGNPPSLIIGFDAWRLTSIALRNSSLGCVITTRTPVVDIAGHERTSALRRELDQLSSEAGAKLLRALGVKGDEAELRNASGEFSGHCLALTLLGSYLTDAFSGDIRFRKEV